MDKQEVIAHLRGLADGSIKPAVSCVGICYELQANCNVNGGRLVEQLSQSWPHFSGCVVFPIEEPSRDCRTYKADIWTDSLRPSLCLHMAEKLEADTDNLIVFIEHKAH